ncbi:MAG: tRNA (adenosine(37)-N6)-threonylcarbamoyltransferase complex dimerization subunit type 1 TsaB [Chloroherpetonaceae bacterium]|nr:tRNA (adenosine(37)-N6)-threonylcarbamoyltransferase complex dimerization subunit type 1 TsaB [Chloroherpetonaceae bacterium]MDW8436901.1 tRNA (adenosine(37)-N6)-threonylcarbamoyltransferase complex dimerization subunit type 1 TsaB [Chloroherpetonaceae bacterium]
MNLLAIDCAEPPLSVAATSAEKRVLKRGTLWQKSGEQIVPLIDEALRELGLSPSDLDAVALSSGPGSFTALRIGIATAKGLCFAWEIPLILIPTFEAMASSTFPKTKAERLITVAYSKADEFYVGIASRSEPMEYDYLSLDALNGRLRSLENVALVGRNLSRWRSAFDATEIVEGDFFSAECLLALAEAKLTRGEIADLASAEPLYLKNFEAKRKRER